MGKIGGNLNQIAWSLNERILAATGGRVRKARELPTRLPRKSRSLGEVGSYVMILKTYQPRANYGDVTATENTPSESSDRVGHEAHPDLQTEAAHTEVGLTGIL